MLDAVHKDTEKPYYAPKAWTEFENPREEKWICCPKHDYEVTIVESYTRELDGKEIPVTSHFKHKPETKGKCQIGESEEHRRYKQLLASLIESDDLTLSIDDKKINMEEFGIGNVFSNVKHRWEPKVEKEKSTDRRRPDLRVPFKKFHPMLGKGIAFEIQLSDIKEKEKQERTKDLVKDKWSVAWLNEHHFADEHYSLTKKVIELDNIFINSFIKHRVRELELMKKTIEKEQEKIEELERNLKEKIGNKIKDIRRKPIKSCRTCKNGDWDENNGEKTGLIACFKHWNNKTNSGNVTKHEPFDTCDEWERG